MKPNELTHYDAQDLRAIESTGRMDANESVFFARQLEYIKGKAYDVKRPKLSALALIPISTEVNEGAESITYRQYDAVGMAKIISNYANDLPRADVTGKEFSSPVRGIGVSYGYSMQEIRAAIYANVNLDARKMNAARRSHEEKINALAWSGDSESGIPGFLSNVNVPSYVLPADGTGSTKTFSTKTPDQIIRDVNGLINSIRTTTKDVHQATEVWMPVAQYTLLATTPRSSTTDTTILEFLQKNNPGVTFRSVVELAGAGTSGTDVMIAGEINEDNVRLEIPMMFRQYAPQPRNLEFIVPCESRFGGCVMSYPLALAKAEGI
jgi:hypothetical protein